MLLKWKMQGGEDEAGAESQSCGLARGKPRPQHKTKLHQRAGAKIPELALGKHVYLVHTNGWGKPKDYREGDLRKKALPLLNLDCLGHHK